MGQTSYDLVILAAGMGSRFGGLKQVEPVGPAGELIIEYSIFDARRAGFGRLVLVIRRDIEADFRATIGKRLESRIDVQYVFQETAALPDGINPSGRSTELRPRAESWGGRIPPRTKPWGTGHAVLAARPAVRGPFAVINADDFYGASGYAKLAEHFAQPSAGRPGYAMVGYPLRQTLSEHGAVSRGLCTVDPQGRLREIEEITGIERTATGAKYTEASGTVRSLSGAEIVSMNFWGFTPAVFPQLEKLFAEFLIRHAGDPKAEFYLPTAISVLNQSGQAGVALLPSTDSWFGITYRDDLAASRRALAGLVAAGRYPAPLLD